MDRMGFSTVASDLLGPVSLGRDCGYRVYRSERGSCVVDCDGAWIEGDYSLDGRQEPRGRMSGKWDFEDLGVMAGKWIVIAPSQISSALQGIYSDICRVSYLVRPPGLIRIRFHKSRKDDDVTDLCCV